MSVYINQLIDVLANAFTLGDGSKSILQKAIFACYNQGNHSPLVKDVIKEVERIESKERVKGWKVSALRALESLNFSNITANDISQKELVEKLIQGNTSVELDGLGDGARKFLIPMLYQWIFQVKLCSPVREKLSIAVFIDEAHLLFGQQQSRSESLMERLLRQTREIGIASIIMDQTPSLISKVVLANCYTNIFLNLASSNDLSKAATVCLLDADDRKYFSRLPVGMGIIKLQDRWTKPFLVRFPHVDVKKGFVTDEVLKKYFNSSGEKGTIFTHKINHNKKPSGIDVLNIPTDEQDLKFINDVLRYPNDGVKVRYKRLGFCVGIGDRVKKKSIEEGYLDQQILDLGKTRKVLLRLTKRGYDLLEMSMRFTGNESIVHGYWKRFYVKRFRNAGYRVKEEAARGSGGIDVLAVKGNEKVAIEIETGKSDVVKNVKADLLFGCCLIVVVATDNKALGKVEKDLAREGLLGLDRIKVVLRDGYWVEQVKDESKLQIIDCE